MCLVGNSCKNCRMHVLAIGVLNKIVNAWNLDFFNIKSEDPFKLFKNLPRHLFRPRSQNFLSKVLKSIS